eukprot:8129824-Pyramimonas_sp.AAC.1
MRGRYMYTFIDLAGHKLLSCRGLRILRPTNHEKASPQTCGNMWGRYMYTFIDHAGHKVAFDHAYREWNMRADVLTHAARCGPPVHPDRIGTPHS